MHLYFISITPYKLVFIFCSCENKIQADLPIADWSDIDYSGNNHISQKMDIYLPKNNNEKHPAVIVIYGSGWSSNNKKLSNLVFIGDSVTYGGSYIDDSNLFSSLFCL